MTRSVASAVQNSFRAGLMTEASGLNYPENSCTETFDCVFDLVGRVTRRLGFDYEFGHQNKTINRSGAVVQTFYWKNVTGDGTLSFIVVQVGTTLYFYDASNAQTLSAGAKTSNVDLTAFAPGGAPSAALNYCDFAFGQGKLFVTHPNLEAFFVTYDTGTGNFTATQIDLKIRDFIGLTDTDPVELRPTSTVGALSALKTYNLLNQGWFTPDKTATAPLNTWDSARTDLPSNCDVWWVYKNSSNTFAVAEIVHNQRLNSPAPKGHYILKVYNQDRSSVSSTDATDISGSTSGIAAVTTGTARAACCAFFAGRVFYSGIPFAGFESKIYFSQIIQRDDQYGLCYQSEDPTSEDFSDLLDSDGGVISIPEAGQIYKLVPLNSGLLVFAYRGTWVITGSTGLGFTAKDYAVSKVSDFGAQSRTSFVFVNGTPVWWNNEGIFTVEGQAQSLTGGVAVKSISLTTINTFYQNIPPTSRLSARGIFNSATQEVHWLYRSTEATAIQDAQEYDRCLTLNVLTGAFSPWTISNSTIKVHAVEVVYVQAGSVTEYTVIDGASETVIDGAGDTVTAYSLDSSGTAVSVGFKYLISNPNGGSWDFTFAETSNANYKDWIGLDAIGVDYSSYIKTGYNVHASALNKFQPIYVRFFNEGNGMYTVTAIWDYANSTGTGRFSNPQTLTYSDNTYNTLHKKIKIRGQGISLQYYIQSVSTQPFKIVGWTSLEAANTQP